MMLPPESVLSRWPADHTIGVYLCVDGEMRPVGTARRSSDVPHLFRHLATAWETYGSLPVPSPIVDETDVFFSDLTWDCEPYLLPPGF